MTAPKHLDFQNMRGWTPGQAPPTPIREFGHLHEGGYRWSLLPPGISFTLDRLRRDRHELIGELSVQCDIDGAKTTPKGSLLTADFNLSSARARQERARLLADRAKTEQAVDWLGYLEEFIELVFEAERAGQPDRDLSEFVPPTSAESYCIDGVTLLKQHPVVLFGDGGSFKSYLALYLAGKMAQHGVRVLYADWELSGEEHIGRFTRLFGQDKPAMRYVRCDRALIHELDRLRRIVRDRPIDYLICDSVAFACAGPPESAEIASEYFRSLRQIGVGSLQIAHISKAEGADQKPFGSAFWHNGARATYYVQRTTDSTETQIGLYPRKDNLRELGKPIAFHFQFTPDTTTIVRTEIRDSPELAIKLSLSQRLAYAVRRGPQPQAVLAELLDAKEDTIRRTVERQPARFTRLRATDGGWKIALAARESSDQRE